MAIQRYSLTEMARMCEVFFPEERRHEFTSEPWDGVSFRHYRDPKITCIEHFMPKDRPILPGAFSRSGPFGRKPAA
jgi:hypothetical protein